MKVDYKVELRFTYLTNKLEDASDGEECWSISQSDSIDFECLVAIAGDSDDVCSRLTGSNGDPRIWKALPNRFECRQAQHYITQLPEIYDQDVSGIELHD